MPTRTALVVDDSKTARVILGAMLERHDLSVDTAETAEQALDYLRHHRPDVIFMDHQMPGMDGLQAVREIKNDPNTAMIPIMMYTAKQGEVYLGQARALGAIGIMSKQVRPAEVFNVLRNLGLAEDRRSQEERESGRPEDVKPKEAVDSLAPDPTPEEFARRTAEYIETKILRAQFPALIDGHLSGIRQEMAKLREDMAAQCEQLVRSSVHRQSVPPEPEAAPVGTLAAVDSDSRSASRWPRRLAAAFVVSLLAILVWVGAQFTNAEQTLAHAKQANSSLLSAVEWSLNQAGGFGYDEVPFDDKRLEMLKDLLLQLSWSQFRGTVQISGHVGRYCLQGNPTTGFRLAAPDTALTQCARIGQPLDIAQAMAEATSDRFSAYLDYLEGLDEAPIRVAISSFGDERPVQAYPNFAEVETAAEWNRIARLNSRLEFKIIAHQREETGEEKRSVWKLLAR